MRSSQLGLIQLSLDSARPTTEHGVQISSINPLPKINRAENFND